MTQEVHFRGRGKNEYRSGLTLGEEIEEFPFSNDQSVRKVAVHLGSIWQFSYCRGSPGEAACGSHLSLLPTAVETRLVTRFCIS